MAFYPKPGSNSSWHTNFNCCLISKNVIFFDTNLYCNGTKLYLSFAQILPILAHKKPTLPTKICIVCNRPFSWRKKWEKVWDEVKYCSDRCRNNKGKSI